MYIMPRYCNIVSIVVAFDALSRLNGKATVKVVVVTRLKDRLSILSKACNVASWVCMNHIGNDKRLSGVVCKYGLPVQVDSSMTAAVTTQVPRTI